MWDFAWINPSGLFSLFRKKKQIVFPKKSMNFPSSLSTGTCSTNFFIYANPRRIQQWKRAATPRNLALWKENAKEIRSLLIAGEGATVRTIPQGPALQSPAVLGQMHVDITEDTGELGVTIYIFKIHRNGTWYWDLYEKHIFGLLWVNSQNGAVPCCDQANPLPGHCRRIAKGQLVTVDHITAG